MAQNELRGVTWMGARGVLLTVPNTSHGNVRALSPVLRELPLTVPGPSHDPWTLVKPRQRCAQTTLRPCGGAPCSHLLPPTGVTTRTPNRTALAPRCMCDTQSRNNMYGYSLGPSPMLVGGITAQRELLACFVFLSISSSSQVSGGLPESANILFIPVLFLVHTKDDVSQATSAPNGT